MRITDTDIALAMALADAAGAAIRPHFRAPLLASRVAVAAPMPEAAPVMRAMESVKSGMERL